MATLALYTAETCDFKHTCVITDEYPQAGQNLAQFGISNRYPTTEEAIQTAHDAWFNEYKHATMDQIRSYPSEDIP